MNKLEIDRLSDIESKIFQIITDHINEDFNKELELSARVKNTLELAKFYTFISAEIIICCLKLFKALDFRDEIIKNISDGIKSTIDERINKSHNDYDESFTFTKHTVN